MPGLVRAKLISMLGDFSLSLRGASEMEDKAQLKSRSTWKIIMQSA